MFGCNAAKEISKQTDKYSESVCDTHNFILIFSSDPSEKESLRLRAYRQNMMIHQPDKYREMMERNKARYSIGCECVYLFLCIFIRLKVEESRLKGVTKRYKELAQKLGAHASDLEEIEL